ncbi:MAG: class III poly(R)-hydroxyalkanoic acid synthase subunit PhaE [Thermomonas sp.]|uniref:poly(R)-hydroxyalkanoic acid synthase subunit PhaE n=1 Tax=Thermomonas sp. TaxID=1971895 RepID=UPI00261F9692|nr:poly(R)-hydroxyalkanoic acid synthase subunit PhaE [Thermomonas sp.]MCC7097067.1 class III poly(R)-hydroxyalkanoic acid synthase subunit PhaE [Thermomonas sp.]
MAEFPKDPAALAQRYWGMWADALRDGSAGFNFDPGKQGLDDALGLWSRQAGWGGGFGDVLERFRGQCGDWYGRMQQVAAQFSGQDHSARDVAEAWRSTFAGGHPFDGLMQGLQGPGLENLARWSEAAMPWLDGVRAQATAALGMPAFGFTREHQERVQTLGKAQLRLQAAQRAYNTLLAKVSQAAMSRFESKLAEHEEPGRQIGSVRALFDLWVDAAEDAWAEAALSKAYRHAFGELANAQMLVRGAAQTLMEQAARACGQPVRSEMDGAYRKIAELERALRAATRQEAAESPRREPAPAKPATKRTGGKPAPKPVAKAATPPKRKPAKTAAPAKTAKKTTKTLKRGKPAARKR